MALLKFFLNQSGPDKNSSQAVYDWDDDPLSHPDLALMSQRQLADLPLPAPALKRCLQRQLENCA